MHLIDLLTQRSAQFKFNQNEQISDTQIRDLITLATLAPSAYHLQNWQFIAVKTHQGKQLLHQASFQQDKILDAAITIIVAGNTKGYKHLSQALQPSLNNAELTTTQANNWINAAKNTHSSSSQLRRDEAFRSASLAAMTLMLAAEDKGYATAAMSGFEEDKIQQNFHLEPHVIPVMLISIGTAKDGRSKQKTRRPVRDVLSIV